MKSCENIAALIDLVEEEPEKDEGQKRDAAAREQVQASIKERAERISRILFVYAREYPDIGYRQGMHEVLSYVLLALEMDLLEQAIVEERSRWRKTRGGPGDDLALGAPGADDPGGSRGGRAGVDAAGNPVVMRLLDEQYIAHDAFTTLECIMTSLAPACKFY